MNQRCPLRVACRRLWQRPRVVLAQGRPLACSVSFDEGRSLHRETTSGRVRLFALRQSSQPGALMERAVATSAAWKRAKQVPPRLLDMTRSATRSLAFPRRRSMHMTVLTSRALSWS